VFSARFRLARDFNKKVGETARLLIIMAALVRIWNCSFNIAPFWLVRLQQNGRQSQKCCERGQICENFAKILAIVEKESPKAQTYGFRSPACHIVVKMSISAGFAKAGAEPLPC